MASFEPDDEEQEDDAEFGDAEDVFGSANEMHDRPDHNACGQIAENGAKAQLLENGGGDDGPPAESGLPRTDYGRSSWHSYIGRA